jgi:hypothetical protein
MIWWNAVLATYITVPALLNSTPLAPNGGVRPVPGPSNGLLLQIVGVPLLAPVFQMMPLPSLSKLSALRPGAMRPAVVGVMNTEEAPVAGSTWSTLPAPKSRTSKNPLTGLKRQHVRT